MPNNDEHSKHTYDIYGVRGEEIHKWMDEPSRLYGASHRKTRHDPDQSIPKIFVEKYGEELARNIIIDHILLDTKTPDFIEPIADKTDVFLKTLVLNKEYITSTDTIRAKIICVYGKYDSGIKELSKYLAHELDLYYGKNNVNTRYYDFSKSLSIFHTLRKDFIQSGVDTKIVQFLIMDYTRGTDLPSASFLTKLGTWGVATGVDRGYMLFLVCIPTLNKVPPEFLSLVDTFIFKSHSNESDEYNRILKIIPENYAIELANIERARQFDPSKVGRNILKTRPDILGLLCFDLKEYDLKEYDEKEIHNDAIQSLIAENPNLSEKEIIENLVEKGYNKYTVSELLGKKYSIIQMINDVTTR